MKPRLLLLLSLAVLPLAGCGSGSSGASGADPAKVVPGSAPVYFEAVVRPEGDLREDAEAALGKLLRTDDPGQKVVELFNQVASEDDVTWDDLKEWLGPRVGVYLSEFSGESPVGAVVANHTDADKAKAALERLAADEPDVSSAIVGDYAVFGSAEGVQAVQAASEAGKGLSDEADYSAARDAVAADEALGLVYVEPQGVLDSVADAGGGADSPLEDPQTLGALRQVLAKAGRAAAAAVHADGDAVRVDAAAIGAPAGETSSAAAESLAALPADAWLAIGFGDLGKALTDALAQISQVANLAAGQGPDFEALFEQFEQRTGVDVREDFLSWMGDGAVYARGQSIADIGGAVTIATKDPAKSRRAVGILAHALSSVGATAREATVDGYDVAVEVRNPRVPVSLFIAANDERFSVGINPQALADVADPQEALGDSAKFETATNTLGGDVQPLAIIDTPTIIGLVEGFGVGRMEGYDQVKPYLDTLGPLSAGSARDGDVARFSFAIGLR